MNEFEYLHEASIADRWYKTNTKAKYAGAMVGTTMTK